MTGSEEWGQEREERYRSRIGILRKADMRKTAVGQEGRAGELRVL